jgi:polyisoprenoid-binding protein YceI
MAWKVDPARSRIEFSIRHLMVTAVVGRFTSFEGTVNLDEDNPGASSVEGTVDVASVQTPISLRDRNLRSAAYFDVKRFPKMSFRCTRVGDFEGDNFKVYGDLTIKDVSRQVVFDVVNKGEMPAEQFRRRWAFGASIVLNRKDYGVEWSPLIELGGLVIDYEVRGTIEIEVVQE